MLIIQAFAVLQGKDLPKWQAKQVLDHSQCSKHPHIIGVEELLPAKDHFCFVMEYLPSGSLTTLLRERSCIPEEEARQYLYELLLGLQHCHSKAVYHRSAPQLKFMKLGYRMHGISIQ